MYIPLGGAQAQLWTVWLIFFFVALWHDIELKLFVWGLLNSVFYVIEILGVRVAKSELFKNAVPTYIQYILKVFAGALFIFVLIGEFLYIFTLHINI